jgi:hypothetical protein
MSRFRFNPVLNFPKRKRGLRLQAAGNGGGKAVLNWSGFNLNAVDPLGYWVYEWSINANMSDANSDILGNPLVQTTEIEIDDPTTQYFFRVTAYDSADTLLVQSNIVGPRTITGDTLGYAYAAALEASDNVDLGGNYEAEMDLFGGFRADGILSKIKAALICGYGTQASCRREAISLSQGTIPGGTVDALAGRVSFTSNGRIRFPSAMSTYVSINSQCFIVDYFDAPSGASIYDLGAFDGTDVNAVFRTTSDNAAFGSFGAGLTITSISSGHVAMWSRTSASAGGAYSWNGTTFSTRITSNALSGGGDTSVVPTFGGLNNNGTDGSFSNSRYRSIWICDGMSSAELQLFCADYQAYKIAKGWV